MRVGEIPEDRGIVFADQIFEAIPAAQRSDGELVGGGAGVRRALSISVRLVRDAN
jgi:hypothetical protein